MISNVDDAVGWLRARPKQFFGLEKPSPGSVLMYVVSDLIDLGGGSCEIRSMGDWWIVGSDREWMRVPGLSVEELFGRLVSTPGHGVHSMRSEVLVRAFCTNVSVFLGDEMIRIVGVVPPAHLVDRARAFRCALLFEV